MSPRNKALTSTGTSDAYVHIGAWPEAAYYPIRSRSLSLGVHKPRLNLPTTCHPRDPAKNDGRQAPFSSPFCLASTSPLSLTPHSHLRYKPSHKTKEAGTS